MATRWIEVEYTAGERLFVDFAGDRMAIVDPATGEVTAVEIFVAVLGCSGLLYVEATRGQDLKSWLLAHVRAYQAYGGVSLTTVLDYVPRYIIEVVCPARLCGAGDDSRVITAVSGRLRAVEGT